MSDLSMFKMQKPMKFHRPTDSGCVVDVVGISRRQHRSLQRQLVGFVQPIYSLFLLFCNNNSQWKNNQHTWWLNDHDLEQNKTLDDVGFCRGIPRFLFRRSEPHFRCQSSKVHQTSNRRCICSQALLKSLVDGKESSRQFKREITLLYIFKTIQYYSIHLDQDLGLCPISNRIRENMFKLSQVPQVVFLMFTTLAQPQGPWITSNSSTRFQSSFRQLLWGDLLRCDDLLAEKSGLHQDFWGISLK